jgi:hypothetical protein
MDADTRLVTRRCRLRSGRLLCRRSRLGRRRARAFQHGAAAMRAPRRKYRQRNGRDHKDDGGPRRRPGEHGRGGAGSECGLAAHAAEGRGDVAALAALQQHHDDEERTNDDVNGGNQAYHVALNSLFRRARSCAQTHPQ